MAKTALLILAVALATVSAAPCSTVDDAPCVSGVSPQQGSINGATRVTLHGFGFVGDLYSGTNEVYMVSDTRQVNCTIHQDGCTEIQIMCYTEPMPADDYYVKVVLDGVPVPTASHCNDEGGRSSDCQFTASVDYTPSITSFPVKSQAPGNFLEVEGQMFTSLYGTNEGISTNGKTVRFSRVWTNSGKCDLVDENAEFYDLALDGEEGEEDTGHFQCLPTGTYIGNQNLTYIINGTFGRSKADLSAMNVMGNNELGMFQTYAEVTGVSHSSGSVEGGVPLTISGNNFDNTRGEPKVTVGGVDCEDSTLSGSEIHCTIPEQPETNTLTGNRGVSLKFWNISESHSDNDTTIRSYTSPDVEETLDEFEFAAAMAEDYSVAIMQGVFVAPSANRYKFFLAAADQAVLYLSTAGTATDALETLSVESDNLSEDGVESDDYNLEAGQEVYLEVIVRSSGGGLGARVSAHMYNTVYTGSQSGQAKNEIHRIATSSDVVHEVQRVTLNSWVASSNLQEERQSFDITIEGSNPSNCFYRIKLFNSYTVRLAVNAQSGTIKQALMALPYFTSAETLGEPQTETLSEGTSWRYTLAFKFLGDYPAIQVRAYPLSGYQCTMDISPVTVSQDGLSTGHYIVPFFMNIPGSPISKDNFNANTLQESIETMFSVQCPDAIVNPTGSPYKEDFEGSSGSATTSEYEPFCGRSAATPHAWADFVEMYHAGVVEGEWNSGIGGAFSKVCFAYRGNIRSTFLLRYMYEGNVIGRWFEHEFNSMHAERSPDYYFNQWNYWCLDLFTDFIQENNADIASSASVDILHFRLYNADTTGEYPMLIDTISFNRDYTTDDPAGAANYERMRMDEWVAETISVESVADVTDAYDITIQTLECASNLPLIEFSYGEGSSTSADSATWSFQDGASVSVERQSAASPPVTGTIRVSSGSSVQQLSAQSTEADQLENYFSSLSADVGLVSVEREGDCRGYTWDIEYTSVSGDHVDIEDAGSSVSGINAAVTISKIQDGGVHWDPVFGDLMKTYHETPQVVVSVNSIPSLCTSDCSFEWSEADTPTIDSISPTSGGYGDTVTIQGSGFSTSTAENQVLIGRASCTVTGATANSITCTVGEGNPGPRAVKVVVLTKGAARNDSLVQFTYSFAVDSVSPSSGYSSGGAVVTVLGSGFGDEVEVTIGGNVCDIISADYTEITCTAPAGTSGSQSVVVSENGVDASGSHSFTYSSASAAITAISTSSANVGGDTEITITGSGFGAEAYADGDSVVVGNVAATVESYSDTEIVAALPVMEKGSYTLNVMTDASGYADRNTDTTIEYTLRVDNVFPRQGSLMGGQKLTLTGQGFSTSELNTVTVGGASCAEQSATDTQIICLLDYATDVYTVTNQGSHRTHGSGYAWSPNYLEVEVGDFVSFEWTTPESVTGIGYRVVQVSSPGSAVATSSGFTSSSIQTANGVYLYQFTETGTFYYYSGEVTTGFGMWGTVVVSEKANYAEYVTLTIGDVEADYNPSSGVADPSDSSDCSPLLTIPTCDEVTGSDADRFDIGMWTCMMPTITSIQPATVVANQDITITGTGFSSTLCQNEVLVEAGDGEHVECVVGSASATQIVCSIPPRCEGMPIGVSLSLTVRINNYGYALDTQLAKTDRGIVIGSSVTSVTPTSGSTQGGQQITVTGTNLCYQCGESCSDRRRRSNLEDHVTLDGGNVAYSAIGVNLCSEVTSESASEVVCTTRAVPGATMVTVSTQTLDGVVTDSTCGGSCDVTLTSDATPTVTDASPDAITANGETLSLTGANLGSDQLALTVSIGNTPCEVTSLSDNGATQTIECDVGMPLGGAQRLYVTVDGLGDAERSFDFIDVTRSISSVSPSTFGTAGGATLVISGVGFQEDDYSVTVGGEACTSTSFVSNGELTCIAPALASGTHSVVVTSGGVAVTSDPVTVDDASAPTISSVNPTQAVQGEDIVVTGTNLVETTVVNIDGAVCTVHTYSGDGTTVTCTLGAQAAGTYSLDVTVVSYGIATGSVEFTYSLAIDALSESSGSFGGGQALVITGRGFNAAGTSVTICGDECVVDTSLTTATELTCTTPANAGSGSQTCDVTVTDDVSSASETSSSAYTYTGSSVVTSVNPVRGGTGGGTTLTIGGSGFGTDSSAVDVHIAGSECVLTSVADNQIVCVTEPHEGATESQVEVRLGTTGIASQQNADYEYIDLWSSVYTWGGEAVPGEGEIILIPEGMTVLLDTHTPILKMLIINGGKVIFENEESSDLLLQAEIIFIANGGVLQVGTEDEHFVGEATIMLHGHVLSKELPIYGTKVLAVRQGTLDLHGKPTTRPWTRLDGTVSAGASSITLEQAVDWEAGNQIVIATTGERHSQGETEQHTIASVSNGGRTLTLEGTLAFDHLGEDISFHGQATLPARAEVGLLSRNLKFMGNNDVQWNDEVEACPDGFDTGEFVTQTCFQGRFGEETGSNEFGAQILMHAPNPNQYDLTARVSNVELNYVGQAYRLGRYAIHFHLLGDMTGSYIRSCAIHRSFNRAVNIHGTHNVLIDHNVAYNIMGGAFFLEDGVETGNVFQYNLAVFVKSSTSLQNDDITPAAYWVTNANNTYQHNVAAGGTHFGFWYRMHEHPDGPSFDPNYCPTNIPMGHFENNTVHSFGWFGIWIFETFTPVETGCCGCTTPAPARFYSLTAWNCEKGAEWVGGGAIQWLDFLLVNNEKAGIEMKMIEQPAWRYSETHGAVVGDGTIVAYDPSGVLYNAGTARGIIAPYDHGLIVRDMHFINFVGDNVCYGVTHIDGTTDVKNGGYTYQLSGHEFTNTDNIVAFRWEHEAVFKSTDDTLTGVTGQSVIACTPVLPPECAEDQTSKFTMGDVNGCVCAASVGFHRFSFNEYAPDSLEGKEVSFTNDNGESLGYFKKKRKSHTYGWEVILPSKDVYQMKFVDAEQLVNISYSGVMSHMEPEDWIVLQYEMYQRPDMVSIDPAIDPDEANSSSAVTFADNYHGDWFIGAMSSESEATNVTYPVMTLVSGNGRGEENDTSAYHDRGVTLNVYRCHYDGCTPPPDPETLPPSDTRPADAIYWSDAETWAVDEETGEIVGALDHDAEESRRRRDVGLPEENQDIVIETGSWVVLDVEDLPEFGRIFVYGTLEFEWEGELDLFLSATHIFISGGRLIVGWEEYPISGSATIELRGNWFTDDLVYSSAPNIGSKVLAVFGGLDMHGQNVSHSWTQLASTAAVGDTSVTLVDSTDWQVGSEIAIATTSYAPLHSEQRTITEVSEDGRTLTFAEPLEYDHIASMEDIGNGEQFRMAAEVGLLTRNIKIQGKDYNDGTMLEQGFGGRVLISKYAVDDGYRTGYARLTNVEMRQMGQNGWSDYYDPRFSLAFVDTGDVTDAKPSYIRSCSFHDNYNTAFGAFGANGLVFESNVVYKTVGSSVRFWDQDHEIRDNLIMHMFYAGTWNGREEYRYTWYAMLEIISTIGVTMTGNHLAGGERAGYRVDGEVCGEESLWSDNVAHSTLGGITQLPDTPDGLTPCQLLNGFITWKNLDFGIYSQVSGSIQISNHVSIDDLVSVMPMILGPASKEHVYENKYLSITDSHYVGYSTQAQCTDGSDVFDNAEFRTLLRYSNLGRSWGKGVRSGITWAVFTSAQNSAPTMGFMGLHAYQALRGKTIVTNTTMKSYDGRCMVDYELPAYAFYGTPWNDDVIHPMYTSGMTLEDVDPAYLVHIPQPNVRAINPSDCIDMDCDGLKKAFLADRDGTLLGNTGTILAFSEYEWDGDRRRGYGDYRLPQTMLTEPDGTRIPIDSMADHVARGIVRNTDTCTFRNSYNAWMCTGESSPVYHMAQVESMDSDTESRRCGPLGVMNTDTDERYIDLINGPQDHGWCMGYTCQERLSTFPVVFAANKSYELHFKGTTPQHLRFHWLNPEETSAGDAIALGIHYMNPYRLDVYVDGEYKMPVNGYMENDQLRLNSGDFTLDPISADVGDNWMDSENALKWITLKGDAVIEIQTSPVIFVSFDLPFMTTDEFFGPNMVNNMAAFFGIPESRIRVAHAVREDGNRKKRTSVIEVVIEIANPPHDLDVSDPSDLSTEELQSIASSIIDTYQLGELDDVLEVTILTLTVTEPVPASDSEEWQYLVQLETNTEVSVSLPETLALELEPVPQHEGAPFRVQPALRAYDADDAVVTSLGSLTEPWEVTAYLFHISTLYSEAELVGTESASSEGGWFNFTDLGVSHAGNYEIQFMVTSPEGASHLRITSAEFNVNDKEISAVVTSAPNMTYEGDTFDVTVGLADGFTRQLLDDIAWRGHTWEVTLGLYSAIQHPGAMTVPTATATVNPSTGTATFAGISIARRGRYYLQFQFVSTPTEYNIAVPSDMFIDVFPAGYSTPVVERFDRVAIRFEGSYAEVAYELEDYFAATVYNEMFDRFNDRASFDDFEVYEGSIIVEFDVSGNEADIEAVIAEIYDLVNAGLTVTFNGESVTTTSDFLVNGDEYGDDDDSDEDKEDDALPSWAVVLIIIACLTLFLALVGYLVYRVYSKKRIQGQMRNMQAKHSATKEHRANRRGTVTMGDADEEGYYGVFREGSALSSSSSLHLNDEDLIISAAAPPAATLYSVKPSSGRPSMGDDKPGTPRTVSASAVARDDLLVAPGTPEKK